MKLFKGPWRNSPIRRKLYVAAGFPMYLEGVASLGASIIEARMPGWAPPPYILPHVLGDPKVGATASLLAGWSLIFRSMTPSVEAEQRAALAQKDAQLKELNGRLNAALAANATLRARNGVGSANTKLSEENRQLRSSEQRLSEKLQTVQAELATQAARAAGLEEQLVDEFRSRVVRAIGELQRHRLHDEVGTVREFGDAAAFVFRKTGQEELRIYGSLPLVVLDVPADCAIPFLERSLQALDDEAQKSGKGLMLGITEVLVSSEPVAGRIRMGFRGANEARLHATAAQWLAQVRRQVV